jgi:hypothetical protein
VSQVDQAVLAPRFGPVAAQIQAVQVVLEMVAMGQPLFLFFDASWAVESVERGDLDLGRHSGQRLAVEVEKLGLGQLAGVRQVELVAVGRLVDVVA